MCGSIKMEGLTIQLPTVTRTHTIPNHKNDLNPQGNKSIKKEKETIKMKRL